MPTIPGSATEIRYRRTGPLAGRYVHRFRPGVRMRANADGSVTLRGRARIHATEDEVGFWQKYGIRHGSNPRQRRRHASRAHRPVIRITTPPPEIPWGWIFAGVLLWTWSARRATGTAGEVMPGRSTISLSDTVRTMQADAEALAASPYTSLSDYLRSGPGESEPYISLSDRLRSEEDAGERNAMDWTGLMF